MITGTEIVTIDAIKQDVSGVLVKAEAFQITDTDSLQEADRLFNEWGEREKAWFNTLDPARAAAYKEYKAKKDLLDAATEPYKAGREKLGKKIIAYKAEVRRQEEAERARLQAIADQQAKEAQKKEAEALLEQAATVEKGGDSEQAAALIEEAVKIESAPVQSVHVEIAPTLPKLQSVEKQTYYAEVVDLDVLIKAVFEGKVPRAAIKIEADMSYLNARAKKEETSLNIPGVVAKPKDSLAKGRSKPATDIFGSNNVAAKGTAVVPLF